MPYCDSVALGQAVILAPMDDQLGCRPFTHGVRGAIPTVRGLESNVQIADDDILARQCKGFLFPGTSSPFVVELARYQNSGLMQMVWRRVRTKKSSSVA